MYLSETVSSSRPTVCNEDRPSGAELLTSTTICLVFKYVYKQLLK